MMADGEPEGREEKKVPGPLKLRAIDEDDLAVLSACLQDALVPAHDMCFLQEEGRFVLVANRFCWEKLPPTSLDASAAEDAKGPFERVHCGLSVEHVKRVQTRGFSTTAREDAEKLFEILTILLERATEGAGGALVLVFAGGAAVRLEVDAVEIIAQDVGEPWPTLWRPRHPFDDEEA